MPAPTLSGKLVPRLSYRPLFWLLLMLLLLYRVLIFKFINLVCLDSDQAFMWAGLADYAGGIFMEPRFYGQDYNTFFEAFVAIPFYWIGIPVHVALPLGSYVCFLAPWIIPAAFLYRKGDIARACTFLAVSLCLLIPYDVITGIPRGFNGGLALMLLMCHSLRYPSKLSYLTANIVLSVIAYFINPNSLLVSAPCLFYLWLHNLKSTSFYLRSALALPIAVSCWLLFDLFYYQHPEFVVYNVNLELSLEHLSTNLRALHSRLAHVSFFSATHAWFTAAGYLLLLAALFISNRKAFWAALIAPLIILLSIASNKGGDGSMWPFYSYGRNYIGLPLFFALFLTLLPARNELCMALVLAALITGIYKLSTFNRSMKDIYDETNWLGVHLVKLSDATHSMQVYKEACKKYHTNQLLVSNNFWLNTVIAYGGSAVHPDFPTAFETNNERRYWLREGLAAKVVPSFVYISSRSDLEEVLPQQKFSLKKLDDYGMYLVKDNSLRNRDFISLVWEAEKSDP